MSCCVAVSGPVWAAEAGWAGTLEGCCRSSLVPAQPEAIKVLKAASLRLRSYHPLSEVTVPYRRVVWNKSVPKSSAVLLLPVI